MKKLSVKGLAEYMTADASRQRSILRSYKYPEEDDARAKIIYYRDARDRISAYHRSGQEPNWLLRGADELRGLANLNRGNTKTRLTHNARALTAYEHYFSQREFEVLADLKLQLQYGDVTITVNPDLHVKEANREKIVKLDFGVEIPDQRLINILSQTMFEATQTNGLSIAGSGILYLDVPRGAEYRAARIGARLRKDIEATCENISAIWDRI